MRCQTSVWLPLTLLAVSLATSLAQTQQSSSKLAPYACFYGECMTSKATGGLESCLKEGLPTDTAKIVVLPGSPAFAYAAMMVNSRFKHTPVAVVYAHQTSDVQVAVKCAYKNGVRVTVAGGRHSYAGWTVVPDFLVVDVSNMTQVKVTGKQGKVLTVQVGPGNTNALLISQLHKQGYSTAGTIVGQCPSVGVSGYMLGGGQGDLSRMFGLACDQLVALEMVTYTGEVVTANAQQNSDLLWASCGGGGGLGVVTQWTVKAHELGSEPFSRVWIIYNAQSAIPAMLKVQEFIMSEKTDLRFSGGGAPLGAVNLYFAGPLSTAMRLLKEGGLLNPAWLEKAIKTTAVQSRAHLNQAPVPISVADLPSVGVLASTYTNYYETIMLAECDWVAGKNPMATAYINNAARYGFGPDKSCWNISTLNRFKVLAQDPGSPINSGISDIWRQYGFITECRLLPPLNATAWEALAAVANDPRCTGKGETMQELQQWLQSDPDNSYYCFALNRLVGKPIWTHLLGGAVAQVPSSVTAYPWRKAISPLCFPSGLSNDILQADGVNLKSTYDFVLSGKLDTLSLSPAALEKGIKAVQSAYHKALYRVLGEDTARAAYLNYQTDQVKDYEAAYWGPNYNRLQGIKAKWDPEGVFSKPFTVQPAKA